MEKSKINSTLLRVLLNYRQTHSLAGNIKFGGCLNLVVAKTDRQATKFNSLPNFHLYGTFTPHFTFIGGTAWQCCRPVSSYISYCVYAIQEKDYSLWRCGHKGNA